MKRVWIKRVFHEPIRAQRNRKHTPKSQLREGERGGQFCCVPTKPLHFFNSKRPSIPSTAPQALLLFSISNPSHTPHLLQFQAFRAVWVNGGVDQLRRSKIGGSSFEGLVFLRGNDVVNVEGLHCFLFSEAHLEQKVIINSERSEV